MRSLGICVLAACSTRPPPVVSPPPPPAAPPGDAAVVEVPLPGHDLDGAPLPAGASARLGTLALHHRNGASLVAYSPDGQHVATADDQDVVIWSLATGQPEVKLGKGFETMMRLAYSPDGKLVVGGGWETGPVHAWHASGGVAWELDTEGVGIEDLAWSPDSSRVAFAGVQHQQMAGGPPPAIGVFVVDAATGKLVHDYADSESISVSAIAFSPDGKSIAYARTNEIVIAEPDTGKIRAKLKVVAKRLRFAADAKSLLVVDDHSRLVRWDLATRRPQTTLAKDVTRLAVSPDGTRAAVGSEAGLSVIDLATGTARALEHSGGYAEVAPTFSADGRRVTQAYGWQGSSVHPRTWDAETGALVPAKGHRGAILAIACHGGTIVTAGGDGEVIIWDVDGHERARLPRRPGPITRVRFSRDGKRLLLPGGDKTIVIWDLAAGAAVGVLAGHDGTVGDALWLDDGRIASATRNELFVWKDGQIEKRLEAHGYYGNGALALSPDGTTLALGGDDVLFPTATFANPTKIDSIYHADNALAYTPDGKTLIGAGNGGYVVDTSGHEIGHHPWPGHTYSGVAVAPDGAWFVAVGDYSSGIYSVPDMQPLASLDRALGAAALCPDGKRAITAGGDGTAIVWSVKALLEHSHGEAGR